MIRFDCPATYATVTTEEAALLSVHRTAMGATAYARCSCGGLAVLRTDGGTGWQQIGHGAVPERARPEGVGCGVA